MAIICVFDIVTEIFDIFPDWKRRQLLCLDELLRVIYENSELWHIELFKYAFHKDRNHKKINASIYLKELALTEKNYGLFGKDSIQ